MVISRNTHTIMYFLKIPTRTVIILQHVSLHDCIYIVVSLQENCICIVRWFDSPTISFSPWPVFPFTVMKPLRTHRSPPHYQSLTSVCPPLSSCKSPPCHFPSLSHLRLSPTQSLKPNKNNYFTLSVYTPINSLCNFSLLKPVIIAFKPLDEAPISLRSFVSFCVYNLHIYMLVTELWFYCFREFIISLMVRKVGAVQSAPKSIHAVMMKTTMRKMMMMVTRIGVSIC